MGMLIKLKNIEGCKMKKKRIVSIIVIIILIILLVSVFNFYHIRKQSKNIWSGLWIADGTQIQSVLGYENGQKILSDISKPFYLKFYKNKKYTLEMSDITEKGTYSVNDKKEIIMKNSEGLITEHCNINNDKTLSCFRYASSFKKIKEKN